MADDAEGGTQFVRRPIPRQTRELKQFSDRERDPLAGLANAGTPADSGKALAALIRGHPFMAFYIELANFQWPTVEKGESKVAKLRQSNKKSAALYWLFVGLDTLFKIIAISLVILLACTIAYKAVMPLPDVFPADKPQ